MGNIEHIILLDIEERHAPPAMSALKIEYIGAGGGLKESTLSLSIGKVDEDGTVKSFSRTAEVCVDAGKFQNVIDLLKEQA